MWGEHPIRVGFFPAAAQIALLITSSILWGLVIERIAHFTRKRRTGELAVTWKGKGGLTPRIMASNQP